MPELLKIVDLPVADDAHGAVFIVYGLAACFEVDDAQPAVPQEHRVVDMASMAVRPPVCDGLDSRFPGPVFPAGMGYSENAAHLQPLPDAGRAGSTGSSRMSCTAAPVSTALSGASSRFSTISMPSARVKVGFQP